MVFYHHSLLDLSRPKTEGGHDNKISNYFTSLTHRRKVDDKQHPRFPKPSSKSSRVRFSPSQITESKSEWTSESKVGLKNHKKFKSKVKIPKMVSPMTKDTYWDEEMDKLAEQTKSCSKLISVEGMHFY